MKNSHRDSEIQRNRCLRVFVSLWLILLCVLSSLRVLDAFQTPQPFPRPGQSGQTGRPVPAAPPQAPPQTPAAGDATRLPPDGTPTEATLGVPIFPGAQFITSYDAGRGQRYYIFGSPATFVELVAYYRTVLKQKGELVYDMPATHEFDIGKFNEDTMAFAPGVTIKDFQSDISQGYPNPKPGGQPARFPTLIQIVPVTGR
ncbi:MAG: hypothetical protein JWL71_813 [Acidobacteria bacterium]|nr:hypothetical protein [Acidobacteriota bacterium]